MKRNLEAVRRQRGRAPARHICTKERKRILCDIVVGTGVLDCPQIKLHPHGVIAEKYIRQLNDFYKHICVDRYVIMPDHIHFILSIDNGQSGRPVPTIDHKNSTVAKFVSTLKRFCNKEYGNNIWQPRYYDHVIRNEEDYRAVWEYMDNNPISWLEKSKTQGE